MTEYRDWQGTQVLWEYDQGGYDWWGAALLRRSDEGERVEYGVLQASGCSCSYLFEGTPDGYDVSWYDDIRVAQRALNEQIRTAERYDIDAAEKVDLITRLRRAVRKAEEEL